MQEFEVLEAGGRVVEGGGAGDQSHVGRGAGAQVGMGTGAQVGRGAGAQVGRGAGAQVGRGVGAQRCCSGGGQTASLHSLYAGAGEESWPQLSSQW